MWQYGELGDERRPAARCRVCKSCSNKASDNATHLIWHFNEYEAEYKVCSAVTAWIAALKLQTLLTSLGKHNLCCYRLLQIIFIPWAKYAVMIKLWRHWKLMPRLDNLDCSFWAATLPTHLFCIRVLLHLWLLSQWSFHCPGKVYTVSTEQSDVITKCRMHFKNECTYFISTIYT